MHFPAEMLPNTIVPSKNIQSDKNIHMLLKVIILMETDDTKKILYN